MPTGAQLPPATSSALHIYRSVGRDVYVESTLKLCDYLVRTYLAKVDGAAEMDAEDYEILVRLYRGQLFGLITEWMMQGMQSDILQNFHRVCALRSASISSCVCDHFASSMELCSSA